MEKFEFSLPEKIRTAENTSYEDFLNNEQRVLKKFKFKGDVRKLANIFLMVSALTFSEGLLSSSWTQEIKKDPTEQIDESQEKLADDFIIMNQEQRLSRLNNMSGREAVNLKDYLDEKYLNEKNPEEKDKINQAFLDVHKYCLEMNLDSFGHQQVVSYNSDGYMTINHILRRFKEADKEATIFYERQFSENNGKILDEFMKEVKSVGGSELSRIRQIYNLVAYYVPRFEYVETPDNNYQTFEQMLNNQAGICTEKNGLLVYALNQAGFEAYLVQEPGHISAIVYTAEDALHLDVTSSNSFNIVALCNKGVYRYTTNQAGYDVLPEDLKKFGRRDDDNYIINIELTSAKTIDFVSQEYGIEPAQVKEILSQISSIKPHPLYKLG